MSYMEERLQKIISQAGICSRRKAENLIESGRVFVNGKRAKLGEKADFEKDSIVVSGKPINVEKKVYYMLNKPKAVLVAHEKSSRKTIYDLPSVKNIKEKVFHVGRLDFMSQGLLILTNDGDFANRLSHPKYEQEKTYHVKVAEKLKTDDLIILEEGIEIEDSLIKCKIKRINSKELEITIYEGINRIIRKMMEKLGYKILMLKRVRYGQFELGDLKEGEVLQLKVEKIK